MLVKSECAKLRLGDALYIQPAEENDIDVLVMHSWTNETIFQENNINFDPELKSITELASPEPAKEPAKVELKSMKAVPEVIPPGSPREEDKVPPQVFVQEKPSGDFDSQVMAALQATSLNPRAAPPDEFFIAYSDANICIPIFVLYLFVIVIIKTAGAIFQ